MLVPPMSTLFPYTTLFRSLLAGGDHGQGPGGGDAQGVQRLAHHGLAQHRTQRSLPVARAGEGGGAGADRKSTRLNSSHVAISYAVFCLKKKKKTKKNQCKT